MVAIRQRGTWNVALGTVLLRFLVGSVFATPTAKLLQLDPIGRILLILFRRVVPSLALTAG